jgi:CRP-like cAMP-binding protein
MLNLAEKPEKHFISEKRQMIEKRKHKRVDAINLLNYVCFGKDTNFINHGMGRTLNVSESGIMLETHIAHNTQHLMSLRIGFEDELIDIKGAIVYSRPHAEGKFRSGVHFFDVDQHQLECLKKYIQAFHEQKYFTRKKSDPIDFSGKVPFVIGPQVDYMGVLEEEIFFDGETIVEEGKSGSWVWVILEGNVDIIKKTSKGPLTVLRIGDGSFIGNISSFLSRGNIRNASAVAVGNVQLGLLDTHRLVSEYSTMPVEFKWVLISLNNRLKNVTQRLVQIYLKDGVLNDPLRDKRPFLKQGDVPDKTYIITNGFGSVVRETDEGRYTLADLSKGDFFGNFPFHDLGQEPQAAAVYAKPGLKYNVLDDTILQKAHENLSTTFKNIIENVSTCISVTSHLVAAEYRSDFSK